MGITKALVIPHNQDLHKHGTVLKKERIGADSVPEALLEKHLVYIV